MPSRINCSARRAAASESSRGSNCGAISIRVTSLPRRLNDWANSQPTGPPPMTASRVGSLVKEKTVSLVKNPVSNNPSIGGWFGLVPVATTAFLKASVLLPTYIVFGLEN